MALSPQLEQLRQMLESSSPLPVDQRKLLQELRELDRLVSRSMINEMRQEVTKMTGPDDGYCPCCGRRT